MTAMDLPATGWRLPDTACALLARLVAEHRPDLIVECGSGRSTLVLMEAAADHEGRVVALEHDEEWALDTRWLVREMRGNASVILAPLMPHGVPGLLSDHWYARNAWDHLTGIGMLMVDGPPGGTSRYARHPALPLLRDRLLPGAVVILDDVNRRDEKAIMADWGIEMSLLDAGVSTIGYGIVDG